MDNRPMLSETITNILVPHVPVIEKIVRPFIVYLALIVLLRIFGNWLSSTRLTWWFSCRFQTRCRTPSSEMTILCREA